MLEAITLAAIVLGVVALLGFASLKSLIFICAPNEVLILSGRRRRSGGRKVGYRLIKGGRGVRIPLLERVDRLDLTNMIIELSAQGAYSKGGVPLTVNAVANVKIGGHEPVLGNAIERFLDRKRTDIMRVAKATLEGALRGVLATMTPEEVNDSKVLFAERLVGNAEEDMTKLGLVVDTLNVQSVHDEVQYLDSIGRQKNADISRKSRIAEAMAQADAVVRQAENHLKESQTQIEAQVAIVKAEGNKRMKDITSRRGALVAEEEAKVGQAVAKAKSDVKVQEARIEQVKQRLVADVVEPAKASCGAAEENARASVASIIEDGKARADVLRALAQSWRQAGPHARDIFLLQKFDRVMPAITNVIAASKVDKLTIIDGRAPTLGGGNGALKAVSTIEQIKEVLGIDVVERVNALGRRAD